MKLSICITVYNQLELVKNNLDSIVKYHGDDIEIVISDDNSTDDIKKLVEGYKDYRIKYYNTKVNSGHDKNILNALKCATGEYAMILRSRDSIIADKIPKIMELLRENPEGAYFLFSALDDEGAPKVILSNKIYKKGKEAIIAHSRLMVHPSGNIYNLKYLNFNILSEYIKNNFTHKFSFIIHDLIRMTLAECGDFFTSSYNAWVYSNTIKSKDVAVNSLGNKQSVYCPKLEYERFKCQFEYISRELNENHRLILYKYIIRRYFKSIGYDFNKINKNKEMQKHYAYNEIKYSPFKERREFKQFALSIFNNLCSVYHCYLSLYIFLYEFKISLYYPIRDCFLDNFIKKIITPNHFILIHKVIKKI